MDDVDSHGITDKIIDDFSQPIGKIIMGWAFCDKFLSEIEQELLIPLADGPQGIARRRKLDQKLKGLKQEVQNSHLNEKLKDQLRELMLETKRLSKIRNICAHFQFSEFKDQPEPCLCLVNQIGTGLSESWKTLSELEKVAIDIRNLAFHLRLFAAFVSEGKS